jgi:Astacin (Peptidase family M12A)
MTRNLVWALALGAVAGCGGSPPTSAPSGNSASAGAGVAAVSGQILETVSRRPVSGARIESSDGSVRTDATGSFQLPASASVIPVTITASGHVTRRSFLGSTAASPTLDVIETDSLWNLEFYRELARDGAGGGSLKPLNPWTAEPRFYVDLRPETGSGRAIPESSVSTVLTAITDLLPLLTSDRLMGSEVESGSEPPADLTPGTVVIRWDPVEIARTAGAASGITRGVGGNASVVVLRSIEETGVIYHELGHVLGLYHPLGGRRPSHMLGSGTSTPPFFTEWDVFHARVLYARPPGNTDVDNDPQGFIVGATALRADRVSTAVSICILPLEPIRSK